MQNGHDYPVGKFDHCHNSQYDYGVTCDLAMTLITLLIALYHILAERKCEDFSREIFFFCTYINTVNLKLQNVQREGG